MNRRIFIQSSTALTGSLFLSATEAFGSTNKGPYVRLGGPLFDKYQSPEEWIKVLKGLGYRAAYCPVKPGVDSETIAAYKKAARKNDVVIAEVGAWSNMISPDAEQQQKAIDKCIRSLVLADEIEANCCVNISGSRNEEHWAGPHPDNLTDETFDLVVENTRKVIDAVQPSRTYLALEAMPWSFPDSPEAYLRLIKAIDRPRFGVHFDPVNMVVSPQRYFRNGALVRDSFKQLGPYIRSCHAKDITLREDIYTPHLSELQPGLGKLDYGVFLRELAKLKDIPLMMEHLKTAEEYAAAAAYIRSVGDRVGVEV